MIRKIKEGIIRKHLTTIFLTNLTPCIFRNWRDK